MNKKNVVLLLSLFSCCLWGASAWADVELPSAESGDASGSRLAAPIAKPAAEAPAAKPVTTMAATPSASSQLLQIMLGLGAVLALIYGLAWFLKRFGQVGGLSSPKIKLVSTLSMGTREKLVLAEVNGEQLLLGVTAHNINTLQSFGPVVEKTNELEQPAPEGVVDFKAKLAGLMVANKKPV